MMILVKKVIRQKGKEKKYLQGNIYRGMIRNRKESTPFEKIEYFIQENVEPLRSVVASQ